MKPLSTYLLFILLWLLAGIPAQANIALESKDSAQLAAQYGKLPMSFEANRGQTDTEVRFLSRGPGYALFITPTEAVFSLRKAGNGKSGGGQGTQALNPVSGIAGTSEQARTARPTPAGSIVGRAARAMPEVPADSPDESLAVRMQLIGANPKAGVAGLDELPGKVNYLRGNDPKRWQTNVATYGKVKLNSVYDGVDLVYYGNGRQLEYDFIVAPGADPKAIRLNFSGSDNARLDATGDLLLHTKDGELRLQKPVVYQTVGGKRQNVDGRFVLHDVSVGEGQSEGKSRQIGFQVAAYDVAQPLVIDPVLVYSTYLGGSTQDEGKGIAIDNVGNAYVTGWAISSDFPSVNAKYPNLSGSNGGDAFVTKFSSSGSMIHYSTYLGGSDDDRGNGIAVDSTGNAYVTGITFSSDFPTVKAKYPTLWSVSDAFVAKFSADGSKVLYSTYLGGHSSDGGEDIAVDSTGNAYVTGWTYSSDFPKVNAKYPTLWGSMDAFVVKFSTNGSKVLYSTFLGGSNYEIGDGIDVDSDGNAYVTGVTYSSDFPTVNAKYPMLWGNQDAFVIKFDVTGSKVLYSTYLGGSGVDYGKSIAVDSIGNAYVTGLTSSTDFPKVNAKYSTLRGSEDAFVTKFSANGSTIRYSTYLGGSGNDRGDGIAVDNTGNAYVTGYTHSVDFPTVKFPTYRDYCADDAFVTKFNTTGSKVVYSTYLGGNSCDQGSGIAVDSIGNVYVTGYTGSSDFPTHSNDTNIVSFDSGYNGRTVVFVAKFSADDTFPPLLQPTLSVTPSSLDFGAILTRSSKEQNITVKNTGTGTLTGAVSTSNPFSVVSGSSFSLAPGASQLITVRFSPTIASSFTGNVNFTSNGGGVSMILSGIGQANPPSIGISPPSSLDFGNIAVGKSADLTFSVQNRGGQTMTGTCTTSTPFSLPSGCSFSLPELQHQEFTVRFTPTEAGTFSGSVNFTGNGGNVNLTVTGNGTAVSTSKPCESSIYRLLHKQVCGLLDKSRKPIYFNISRSDIDDEHLIKYIENHTDTFDALLLQIDYGREIDAYLKHEGSLPTDKQGKFLTALGIAGNVSDVLQPIVNSLGILNESSALLVASESLSTLSIVIEGIHIYELGLKAITTKETHAMLDMYFSDRIKGTSKTQVWPNFANDFSPVLSLAAVGMGVSFDPNSSSCNELCTWFENAFLAYRLVSYSDSAHIRDAQGGAIAKLAFQTQ